MEQPKEMEEEIENTKRSFVLNTWPDGDELYTLHGVNPGTIPEKGPRYIGFRREREEGREREYNSKHTLRATPPFGLLSSPISISGAILVPTNKGLHSLLIYYQANACMHVLRSRMSCDI